MSELKDHLANEASHSYARRLGLTIGELKRKDPQSYKMLNSQVILDVDEQLEQDASAIFVTLFRSKELFRKQSGDGLSQLLVFPSLEPLEFEKFHTSLEILLKNKMYQEKYIYYRVISDIKGEHRQLAFPIKPSEWNGQTNWLVGPFESDKKAEAWVKKTLTAHTHLDHDIIAHSSTIFVDIFSNQL